MGGSPFVGMGKNPDPNIPDMPLGLGMNLMQEPTAMTFYGTLSPEDKTRVISYVQKASDGPDARNRIAQAVEWLSDGQLGPFTTL